MTSLIEQIEAETNKELSELSIWMIDIPETIDGFNQKCCLSNDEISIDQVEFREPRLEDVKDLLVDIPETKEGFNSLLVY